MAKDTGIVAQLAPSDTVRVLSDAAASSGWVAINGGNYFWCVYGTFAGSESVSLRWSPDGGSTDIAWSDADAVTANAMPQLLALPEGHVKTVLAIGIGSTITSELRGAA